MGGLSTVFNYSHLFCGMTVCTAAAHSHFTAIENTEICYSYLRRS
jgi:hypothetical protein